MQDIGSARGGTPKKNVLSIIASGLAITDLIPIEYMYPALGRVPP
jgi:hypothetical protein